MVPCLLFKGPDDSGGISYCQGIGWYILCHNAARTYDYIISDGNTGIDDGAASNPHIIADAYGFGIFQRPGTQLPVLGMVHGNDADIRANQAMMSNGNRIAVQYGQIIIGIKMAANADVIAKVAVKWLFYAGILWRMVQDLFQEFPAFFAFVRRQMIILMKEHLDIQMLFQ